VLGADRLSDLLTAVAGTLFRLAQEGVTNARRHAVDVTVSLTFDPTTAHLEVINDGLAIRSDRQHGFGLLGMKERVTALGGTFEARPREGGGWLMGVAVPLDQQLRTAPDLGRTASTGNAHS